jgi:hypothetical protein
LEWLETFGGSGCNQFMVRRAAVAHR